MAREAQTVIAQYIPLILAVCQTHFKFSNIGQRLQVCKILASYIKQCGHMWLEKLQIVIAQYTP